MVESWNFLGNCAPLCFSRSTVLCGVGYIIANTLWTYLVVPKCEHHWSSQQSFRCRHCNVLIISKICLHLVMPKIFKM
jgi:hypothetical protein